LLFDIAVKIFLRFLACTTGVLAIASGCGSPGESGTGGGGSDGAGAAGGGGSTGGCVRDEECLEGTPNGECIYTQDPCVTPSANAFIQCSADQDCTAGDAFCFQCAGGQGICMAVCASDADCKPGTACDPGARCVPRTCQADADCPADFTCAAGACERKTCAADADCAGVCLRGRCVEEAGTCYF
jgi:hypothetical protein